jgi:hypothetical protein
MRLRRRDGVSILGVMWGWPNERRRRILMRAAQLEELNEELEILNVEARGLEETIAENVAQLLNTTLR